MNEKPIDTSKTEWDFSSFISEDVESQLKRDETHIREKVGTFISHWKKRKDYLEDEVVLKKALDEYEELLRTVGLSGGIGYYLHLMSQKKQTDEVLKQYRGRFEKVGDELSVAIMFFELSVAKIPKETQELFLSSECLGPYRHYLERSFASGKYMLSEKEEAILTLLSSSSFDRWVEMVEEFLSVQEGEVAVEGKKEVKHFAEILGLLNHTDKPTRDSASEIFNILLEKHRDVATAELNAIMHTKQVEDGLRGFSRPDESRIIGEDVSFDFVDSLISSVQKRYDISHRFYELKAKLLGLPLLEYHERNVVYGSIDRDFSYEDAVRVVYHSIDAVDGEFSSIVKRLIESGMIDVYPQKGKASGAFCSSGLLIQPTYVFLNHTNKLRDVETLAHELGHAMNHEMMKKQNALHYGVPMVTAEVTSNFSEAIVFESLLKEAKDDEERLALLMNKLNGDISSVMRQIACYTFEQSLHTTFRKKGYLSSDEIGELFQTHMKNYMGSFVEQSEGSENWWIYWSHIRNFFYVYSYAGSLLIANALMNELKQNPQFITNIKTFYSAGRSKAPEALFKEMGLEVNTTFWKKGLDLIELQLEKAETLARKLKKI